MGRRLKSSGRISTDTGRGCPRRRSRRGQPTRTLVLGLGNPILRDDSVGLRVVRALKAELRGHDDIEVGEETHGGLRLMERLIGYDRAIIVDAIRSGAAPGTLHSLRPDSMPTQHSASAHDVGLTTALEVGRRAGARLPDDADIQLVAVEAQDTLNFGEDLTPEVEAALPAAVQAVLRALSDTRSCP